jgi:hypothetical protein
MTAAALGLLAMFALSACVKMDVSLNISGDKVDGTMIVGVDKQVLEMSGESKDELVNQLSEDVPSTEGVTTEPYEDDTFVGTKFTLDDVSLDEFNDDASSSSDDLQIVHDADAGEYKVTGVLDLSEAPAEGPEAELSRSIDIRISITFPGRVISHNGELDGTTVTWQPRAGEKLTLEATAADASSFNWLLVLGIAIPLVLLIGGAIAWVLMRGRSSASAPPVEPAFAGYPGGAPGAGTATYPGAPAYPAAPTAPTYPATPGWAGPGYPTAPAGAAPVEPQFQAGTAWTPVTPAAPPPPESASPAEPTNAAESSEPPTRMMPPTEPMRPSPPP